MQRFVSEFCPCLISPAQFPTPEGSMRFGLPHLGVRVARGTGKLSWNSEARSPSAGAVGPLWLVGVCQLAGQFASTPPPASVEKDPHPFPREEGHVLQARILSRENSEPDKIAQVPAWVLWTPQPLARQYSRHRPRSGGCQPAFPSTLPQFMARAPSPVVLVLARCSGWTTRWRQSLASEGRRPGTIAGFPSVSSKGPSA